MMVEATPLLIDAFMPSFDASIAEHLIVRRDPSATFRAARELDFLSVHTPLLDLAMWARGLPARIGGQAVEPPPRLVLSEGDPLPGWLLLGENPNGELAFGAVGKFWQPNIEWHDVAADEFAPFDEPGWGKIVADFSVLPYGERATLLTYECRTVTTDPASRQRFLRYWTFIRPFVAPHLSSDRTNHSRQRTAAADLMLDRVVGQARNDAGSSVDLYWIPLGAGAHVVRISGKIFEALTALVHQTDPDALSITRRWSCRFPRARFVVEQAPVPDADGPARGVVAQGPVGLRCAGRFRIFRYEVRRWRDGQIPDLRAAIGSPVRVSTSLVCARRVLEVLAEIPTPVWGRDDSNTGEMWNSNSIVSWALTRSGVDLSTISPPAWQAPLDGTPASLSPKSPNAASPSGQSGAE